MGSYTAMTSQSSNRASQPTMRKSSPGEDLTNHLEIAKPKQTKSRNGCQTCKTKRLKCDETKPGCQQCQKRNVVCGGYKKDFKWKPFGDTTPGNKATAQKKSNGGGTFSTVHFEPTKVNGHVDSVQPKPSSGLRTNTAVESNTASTFVQQTRTPPTPYHTFPSNVEPSYFNHDTPMRSPTSTNYTNQHNVTGNENSMFAEPHQMPLSPRPSFSGQSPRLIDLLLPGSELNAKPGSVIIPPVVMLTPPPTSPTPSHLSRMNPDEDCIEEIAREPITPDPGNALGRPIARQILYQRPRFGEGSTEMLMMHFDKQTCGILSIKDGPTENPWRTLVWPLARDSPALYHALASMTAFHGSQQKPSLRVNGMEHMRNSIQALAAGIGEMRTEAALATTLALAFSESWDQHISTGIEHLRGAKILVKQALITNQKQALQGEELHRLRFLCSTFVYMDVIARLTSVVDDEDNDNFLELLQATPLFNTGSEIDPLMGCSATLFPLIGRAANICRKVRKYKTNSVQVIAEAREVKEAIEQWLPPPITSFRSPEDPTSEIQHSLQTAEAYRYATLLYLHQAVPELPSPEAAQLAKKVLACLASVPLTSRLVIVQIYPLLAAGCESEGQIDRSWIEDRWQNMASRMWIGNIDRCWEVMQEVWSRRDQKAAATQKNKTSNVDDRKRKFECDGSMGLVNFGLLKKQKNNFALAKATSTLQQTQSMVAELDPDMTVRGPLHWVGVMRDWGWEILLG